MRIQQCGPPVDSDKTNITRLGNDTLGRKRKQRLRGRTETKATVCDTAGKTDSPDVERFVQARESESGAAFLSDPGGYVGRPAATPPAVSRSYWTHSSHRHEPNAVLRS